MNPGVTDKKARSRERIVDAASKSVRRLGFLGVSVAGVMKEAGLTHGGFYAHFASREALSAEAVGRASSQIAALMASTVAMQAQCGSSAFRTFVETYLADDAITASENGCPVAALCGEMPGQCADVLDASRRIVGNLHRLVQQVLPERVAAEAAWSIAGTLVGAMQIARVFGPGPQGRAVLAAARAQLVAQYDTPR